MARAIFIGALNSGFETRQEDTCRFVVLDFGLVRLFAEKAMDKFCLSGLLHAVTSKKSLTLHISAVLRSNARQPDGLESVLFYFNLVIAGTNTGDGVEAAVSGCDLGFGFAIEIN